MHRDELPTWQTTESKYLVNDRWLKLRADTCVTPEGKIIAPWYVLEYPEWVNCLVIDKDDTVVFLRHYRHGAQAYVQEIVSGMLDPEDVSPQATIARELKEEIGYEGGEIYKTGVAYANPSSQNNKVYTFLAVGGACSGDTTEELGANFLIEKVPFKEFVAHISNPQNGTLYQSLHLASIFFAFNFIRGAETHSKAITRLQSFLN